MVRSLLRNVVCPSFISEIPVTSKDFAEDRIQRFLDASVGRSASTLPVQRSRDGRWTNMPPTKVELDDRDEAFNGIIYGWNMEEHLGMAHEAIAQGLA